MRDVLYNPKETDYPESLDINDNSNSNNNNNKEEPGEVNICSTTAVEANDEEQVISKDNNPAVEVSGENISDFRNEKGVQSDLKSNALNEETQIDDKVRRRIVRDNIESILAPQIQIAGHAQGGATELCQRGLTSEMSSSDLTSANISIATTENCGSVGGLEAAVRTLSQNGQSSEESSRDPANCSEQTNDEFCQLSTAMNVASKEATITSKTEHSPRDQQLDPPNTFKIDTNTSGNEKDFRIIVSQKTSFEPDPDTYQSCHYARIQFQEQRSEIEAQIEMERKQSENWVGQENELNNGDSNEATLSISTETKTKTQTEAESMCHDLNSSPAVPLSRPQPSREGSKQRQPDLVSPELVEHETEFKNTIAGPLVKDAEQINLDEQCKLDEDDENRVSVVMKTPLFSTGK